MPTRKEIERLKTQWCGDPCWDIEHTEGFEEHEDELREHREQRQIEWKKERQAKIQAKADELKCSPELAEYIIRLERTLDKMNGVLENLYFSSHSHVEDHGPRSPWG